MTTNSAGEIVNVRVRLNQILDTALDTAGAFAAPTGMTVSYEGTNITVQPGSIVKDGVVFKLDAPITKNTAELWKAGDLSGGSLDFPSTENWETPVMENNKVVGILTLGDLAKNKEVNPEGVYATLENICDCNKNNAE